MLRARPEIAFESTARSGVMIESEGEQTVINSEKGDVVLDETSGKIG